MAGNVSRPWRAIARNALTWGAAWAVAGGAIVAAFALFDPRPGIESLPERLGMALFAAVSWGVRFGIIGAVIGTAFAAVIRLGYQGRRLADINPLRFTLLGALIGGVGVPLFLQMMNVLSGGGPIAWGLVTDDAKWATLFGAAVAGGTILLARRSVEREAPSIEGQESSIELGPAGTRALDAPQLHTGTESSVMRSAHGAQRITAPPAPPPSSRNP
ncbi:MAG TPA: hypothetical protein VFK36_08860 [Gemmatimonadales bacterium]|nr:hypothetical protein [Gemmatimonadales bacterium]